MISADDRFLVRGVLTELCKKFEHDMYYFDATPGSYMLWVTRSSEWSKIPDYLADKAFDILYDSIRSIYRNNEL